MRAWKKVLCQTRQNKTAHDTTKQDTTLQNSAFQALFCADWQKYTTFHYINSAVQKKIGKVKTLQAFLRDLFLLVAKNRSTQSSTQQTSIIQNITKEYKSFRYACNEQ